jgi:hypothetical protein
MVADGNEDERHGAEESVQYGHERVFPDEVRKRSFHPGAHHLDEGDPHEVREEVRPAHCEFHEKTLITIHGPASFLVSEDGCESIS